MTSQTVYIPYLKLCISKLRCNFPTFFYVSGAFCPSEGEHGDVVLLRANSVRCLTHGTRQVGFNRGAAKDPMWTLNHLNVVCFSCPAMRAGRTSPLISCVGYWGTTSNTTCSTAWTSQTLTTKWVAQLAITNWFIKFNFYCVRYCTH